MTIYKTENRIITSIIKIKNWNRSKQKFNSNFNFNKQPNKKVIKRKLN